ncbi:hypothetical protein CHS0354_021829 [Potamilus streckersoni]|uniref:Uncharacterized protein n=1 Tax=Potamilus streckersoni TaxID=2493646 RepID=A0AAE0S471_9BIVA|nr:hypothetical protein CHS0354_021829 [Potamilus streckersoni]
MHSVNEEKTSSSLDDFVFDPDEMTGIEDEETDGVNTQTTVYTGDVHPWDTSMVDMNTGDASLLPEEEPRKALKGKYSELDDSDLEEQYDKVYITDRFAIC